MKKLLSLLTLSLLLGVFALNAQNPRIVVLECFTSATCSPCAQYNPALDNLVNNNADKLIAIKYHVNWPVAGGDPMNLHNPSEVSSRVSYYGVNSVPHSVADGNVWSGNSGNVSQSLVNQWAAVESPLEMRMTHYLNNTQDTITVIVMGRATNAVASNNMKLRIAVLEETMEYASAPGTNGERIFHNVMKKMLPNATGSSVPSMQAGEYFAFKYSWALANVMNVNELTAVAWLQDQDSKAIFQGCKSSEDFQPFYEKQAKINAFDHTKRHICSGNVNPDILITNYGSEAINSLTINVKVDGNDYSQIIWEGNIPTFGEARINLGDLDVDISENNEILAEIVAINGAPDDYAPSELSFAYNEATIVTNTSFKLQLRTDDDPQSITWDVVNTTTGEVVISGGPYEEANKLYTTNFTIETGGCYLLTVYDAGGNGLGNGNGAYALKAGSSTIISGKDFYDKDMDEFSLAIEDVEENMIKTTNIYPNPTNGILTIDTEKQGSVDIYNLAGQMVLTQKIEGTTVLNIAGYEKGSYLLVVKDNEGNESRQIIVLQ